MEEQLRAAGGIEEQNEMMSNRIRAMCKWGCGYPEVLLGLKSIDFLTNLDMALNLDNDVALLEQLRNSTRPLRNIAINWKS